MRNKFRLVLMLAAIVSLFSFATLADVTPLMDPATAPVLTDTPPPEIPAPVVSALQTFFGKFAGFATTFFIIVGVLRTGVKPILTLLRWVFTVTKSKSDDEALDKFEAGPIMKWLLYILDWLTSIKVVPTK